MNDKRPVIATLRLTEYNKINIISIKDDTIKFVWINGNEVSKMHSARLRRDEYGDYYFRTYHLRIKLKECFSLVGVDSFGKG